MFEFLKHIIHEQYFLTIPKPTASFAHKTVIVTGANSGLGKEAARHISRLGCSNLILAVRNVNAGEEARKEILSTTSSPESRIAVWELDLQKFESVRSFARRVTRELDRLDVLICNAGINTMSYREAEGFESMLTTNVLSTYLLAKLLLPFMESTAKQGPLASDPEPRPPHVCIVTSDMHMTTTFPEQNEIAAKLLTAVNTNCQRSGSRMREQYATTKLLDLLLVRDLVYGQLHSGPSIGIRAVADPEKKCAVLINSPNPGLCQSDLTREMPGLVARIAHFLLRARPAEVGAGTFVYAASAGWETNGQYLSSNQVQHGSDLSWDMKVSENLRTAVHGSLKEFMSLET